MNLQGDLNHVTWPAYSIIIRTKSSYSQNPMIFQNKTFLNLSWPCLWLTCVQKNWRPNLRPKMKNSRRLKKNWASANFVWPQFLEKQTSKWKKDKTVKEEEKAGNLSKFFLLLFMLVFYFLFLPNKFFSKGIFSPFCCNTNSFFHAKLFLCQH